MAKQIWAVRKSDGYAFRKMADMDFSPVDFDFVESDVNPSVEQEAPAKAVKAEAKA